MTDVQARYQSALLRLLRTGADPEVIRATLADDPALAELRDYVMSLDAHALSVAVELVATWSGTKDPMG